MRTRRRLTQSARFAGLAAWLMVGVLACSSTRLLMPVPETPLGRRSPVEETPLPLRTPELSLFYVTDRGPPEPDSDEPYGDDRSRAVAFGTVEVRFGEKLTWDQLLALSLQEKRERKIPLALGEVVETGRFPREPYALQREGERLFRSPDSVRGHAEARAQFQETLQRHLDRSPTKRVLLYVHGFNETFSTSAYSIAELCHFMGREDVCALFTWPASRGGLLSYTETTETAEFAVGHLRKAIRSIAQTPGVESISLLAHSRGSSILLSALRELAVTAVAYGVDPAEALKLNHVVFAAPDVDADVAMAKIAIFASEPDVPVRSDSTGFPDLLRGRFTVYGSPEDRALSASRLLFRSSTRVGLISIETFERMPPEVRALFEELALMDLIINDLDRSDRFGHGYFTSQPRVSADLIELLRHGTAPGTPQRPATPIASWIWRLSAGDDVP